MKELVIDTSNLAHACWGAKGYNFAEYKGKRTGHIYGFLLKLLSFHKKMDCTFVFALDKYPKKTYKIFPGYKANRTKKDFNPVKEVEELIYTIPCVIIYANHTEADSAIASYIKKEGDKNTCIVSADQDLWQLADQTTIVSLKLEKVTKDDIIKKFGTSNPKKIPIHKSIFGDKSDNIPKLNARIQRKLLTKCIDESPGKSLKSLYKYIKEGKSDLDLSIIEVLLRDRKQIRIFYKIAKLKQNKNIVELVNKGNKKRFLKILEKNGIVQSRNTLLKTLFNERGLK